MIKRRCDQIIKKNMDIQNKKNNTLSEREKVDSVFAYIPFAISTCIVLILLFAFPNVSFICKKEFINNWVLLLIGMITVSLVLAVTYKSDLKSFTFKHIVLIAAVVMLLQIWLMSQYYFKPGWDPYGLIGAAKQAANGDKIDAYPFSQYPSNLVLTWIFSKVFKLGQYICLSMEQSYFLLLIIQCILSNIAGILTYLITLRLTNRNIAFVIGLMFILSVELSPWISIPYSDSWGLVLPVTIFGIYFLYSPEQLKGTIFKWIAIGSIAYFGFKIKPQVFIVLIAIVIIEVLEGVVTKQKKKLAKQILCLGIGMCISIGVVACIINDFGFELDKEKAFGFEHFLAMGLNEETTGAYLQEDVDYSASFETRADRRQADLQLAKERIAAMWPDRLAKHYAKKTIMTYHDGTFAWGVEGDFYMEILPPKSKIAKIVRSVYYTDGECHFLFMNFVQIIWITTLVLSFLSVFGRRKNGTAVIYLTMVGIFIYNLLFEARGRYLFINLPFFFILAGTGLMFLENIIRRKEP